MRLSKFLLVGIFLTGISAQAQQKTSLSLKEAIDIALSKSDEVNLANTKAATKKYEKQSVQMNQYPDFKLSGQYMRLAKADVTLKSSQEANSEGSGGSSAESPTPNYLMLGQATASMPIFSGFKLKNSIVASENL